MKKLLTSIPLLLLLILLVPHTVLADTTSQDDGTATLEQPELVSVAEKGDDVILSFKAVANALQYKVYTKTADGEWEEYDTYKPTTDAAGNKDIQPGATVTCTIYDPDSGVATYYTVQALNKTSESTYDSTGLCWKFVESPYISIRNGKTGIVITADTYCGTTKYEILKKTGSGAWKVLKTQSVSVKPGYTKETLTNDTATKEGTKYYYKVKAYYKDLNGKEHSKTTAADSLTRLGAQTLSVTRGNGSFTLKWTKVNAAKGYYIYISDNRYKITSNATLSYVFKPVLNGVYYHFAIVPYAADGSYGYGCGHSLVLYLKRPTISSCKNTAKSAVTIRWTKNAQSEGYQIQYSLYKNFKKGVKTVKISSKNSVSKVIKSLKKNKTYYFKVRSFAKNYQTQKLNYSCWSAVKAVKITK